MLRKYTKGEGERGYARCRFPGDPPTPAVSKKTGAMSSRDPAATRRALHRLLGPGLLGRPLGLELSELLPGLDVADLVLERGEP